MSLSLNNERWEILLSWKNRMWVCGEAALWKRTLPRILRCPAMWYLLGPTKLSW
jgi:hypothetical protein